MMILFAGSILLIGSGSSSIGVNLWRAMMIGTSSEDGGAVAVSESSALGSVAY